MKKSIAAIAMMAILSTPAMASQMTSEPYDHAPCQRALDGANDAWDIVRATSEKPAPLSQADVDLFYAAWEYGVACNEVVLATCGCHGGFICPPASTTAINKCKEVFVVEPPTSEGRQVLASRYNSEAIGGGLYMITFSIPVDVFDPSRSSISVAVDTTKPAAATPLREIAGTKDLYIFNSSGGRGAYRCKGEFFEDIENESISLSSLWDANHRLPDGSGATNRDPVRTRTDHADCDAIANQPFTIIVKTTP